MSFPYLLILTYVNVPFYPKENAYGTECTQLLNTIVRISKIVPCPNMLLIKHYSTTYNCMDIGQVIDLQKSMFDLIL